MESENIIIKSDGLYERKSGRRIISPLDREEMIMSKGCRGDVMIRAFKVIEILQRRSITVRQLAKELDCNIRTAYRYIDAASIVFPVMEYPETRNPKQFTIKKT